MPLGSRRTLVLIAVYIAFAAAITLWLDHEGRGLAIRLINNTARLIGREVSAALSQPALDQLVQKDGATRQRLQQVVDDLTGRSEVIDAIDVLDEDGRIVASDDPTLQGTLVELPQALLQPRVGTRFPVTHSASELGIYQMYVPLVMEGTTHGYLRLSLNNHSIARLHYQARRKFVLFAVIGLIGMAVLGALFHFQVSRRSEALAQALETALRGEPPLATPKNDVFARAFDAARRVGEQLSHERERSVQAHSRVNAMLKSLDVGLLLLQSNRELEFANAPAREILGYEAAGELEQHWAEIKERLAPALPMRDDATGLSFDIDLPRNGSPHRLRFEIYPVSEGEAGGYLVLVKSREMMEALENELGLAIQMRGLVRFHMAFVHDLRAPLNAMGMNLELLKQTLLRSNGAVDETTKEKQFRYLGVLKDELARVDRQLGTLLTHSAPPGDTWVELDVTDLVRELVALLGPMAHIQRVKLETRLPEEPIRLHVQRDRLKQAILNIAINALEAMPEGGTLAIEVEPHGSSVRVAFRDTGPGIPPEVLDDIYKMHFTTKAGGTGIGLYVARAVAEAHGGEVRVESSSGGGTCLGIYLPRSDQELSA